MRTGKARLAVSIGVLAYTWLALVGLPGAVGTVLAATPTAGSATQATPENAPVVKAIAVKGTKLIPIEQVFDAITETKVGEPLDQEKVQSDFRHIVELGVFTVNVRADLSSYQDGVRITFIVEEFPPFKGVDVVAVRKLPDALPVAEIPSLFSLKSGEVIHTGKLRSDLQNLTANIWRKYGVLVGVHGEPEISPSGTVTVGLVPIRLGAYHVEGNKKTKTGVILREMTLQPGDPIVASELGKGLRRLSLLGHFEDVVPDFADPTPGEDGKQADDTIDIVLKVTERRTGSATFGAGYSSVDGFVGQIEVRDDNFLGKGQRANLRWEFGKSKSTYDLGFFEPQLDDKRTSIGFNLYNRSTDREDKTDSATNLYNERRLGGDVTLGRPLSENTRASVRLKAENTWITPKEGSSTSATSGGTRSLTLSTQTDTTNELFFPSVGYRSQLSVELAGQFLGGDYNFTKYTGDISRYFKAGVGDQVWALRLSSGLITGDVPLQEQFRVGGPETVRGYKYGDMQGSSMIVMNAEYRFPIAKSVQGVVFADAGRAWTTEQQVDWNALKKSAGVGVRLSTPIGILRIDYGFGDEGGKATFSLGQSF